MIMKKLTPEFFRFIKENIDKDPLKLRLSTSAGSLDFDVDFAITQIECRKKTNDKLKKFLANPEFIFPDNLSAEQASHQAVSLYHLEKIGKYRSLLDMTAGLGIDSLTLGSENKIKAIELDVNKAEVLKKNADTLNIQDFEVICGDSVEYLKQTSETFDVIFADPARRDYVKNRVYNLHDCSPDILSYNDLLLKHADRILIKASPLLDVSQTLKDFNKVISIEAVGVKGECKEILIELSNKDSEFIELSAVNLDPNGNIISKFSFHLDKSKLSIENKSEKIIYAELDDLKPGYYILEPSAMVMKVSPWAKICSEFKALKFDVSSNLFLTENYPYNFPGRVTQLDRILKKPDRKSMIGYPASVISRNYPLSSEKIRSDFKLKEGDDNFIYASRIKNKPVMLLSSKTVSH